MTIFTYTVCEHVPFVGMGEGKDGGVLGEESVSSCKLQCFKSLEPFFPFCTVMLKGLGIYS